ncbi:MAG: hypothetical protein LDL41_25080 [Coleofasciculus sp. S288]|nr:hypothetical protein [Coleofasciculus sp. S288]
MPYQRANYNRAYPQELRTAWAHVLAVAWMNEEILDGLRDDPKNTIEGVAEGRLSIGPYDDQRQYFATILEHEEGVFGLPNPPQQTETLRSTIDIDQLASFLDHEGLFGIIRGT